MRPLLVALAFFALAPAPASIRAQDRNPPSCPRAEAEQPPSTAFTLTPGVAAGPIPPLAPLSLLGGAESQPAGTDPPPADYRHRLRPTPLGWARLPSWCLWVEPATLTGPSALWEGRWFRAVQAAVDTWSGILPITRVSEPERAQILVERRRPPLQATDGRWRASHGRALLRLRHVQREQLWRLEPEVRVLIGPGQSETALQATALHELGHAIGLWGHSDHGDDAMAATPGPRPTLSLSERDRRTVRWLYQQPTIFGRAEAVLSPAGSRQ